MVGVVLLGSLANLATVGNTIAVERDWVVVIADKNSTTLASMIILTNLCKFMHIL